MDKEGKMNKIQKILIFLLIILTLILFSSSKVQAISVGNTITVGYANTSKNKYKLQNNTNLYCIQHGGSLSSYKTNKYTVKTKITISGRTATVGSKSVTNDNNAKLAYYLSAPGYGNKGYGKSSSKTTRQKAVWGIWGTWIDNVGKSLGLSSWRSGNSGSIPSGIKNGANTYVENLKNNSSSEVATIKAIDTTIVNNTVETTKESDTVNNEKTVVGPFKIQTNATIKEVNVECTYDNGTTNKWDIYNNSYGSLYLCNKSGTKITSISSNTEFYICNIYKTNNRRKISNVEIKVSKTSTTAIYGATMYLLKSNTGSQRLMWVEPKTTKSNEETGASVNIKVDVIPEVITENENDFTNLAIGKHNENGVNQDNVGFKIQVLDKDGTVLGWLQYKGDNDRDKTTNKRYNKDYYFEITENNGKITEINYNDDSTYFEKGMGNYAIHIPNSDSLGIMNYYNAGLEDNTYIYNERSFENATIFRTAKSIENVNVYKNGNSEPQQTRVPSSGLKIHKLSAGYTYRVYEVDNPNDGYGNLMLDRAGINLLEKGTYSYMGVPITSSEATINGKNYPVFEISSSYLMSFKETWTTTQKVQTGTSLHVYDIPESKIKIIKEDWESNKRLSGAEFKIQVDTEPSTQTEQDTQTEQNKGWLKDEGNGIYSYDSLFEDATTFTTDINGEAIIEGLRASKNREKYQYTIYETKAPDGYTLSTQANYDANNDWAKCSDSFKLDYGKTTEVTITNTIYRGIRITKEGEPDYEFESGEDILYDDNGNEIGKETMSNVPLDAGFQIYYEADNGTKGWIGAETKEDIVDGQTIIKSENFNVKNQIPQDPLYTSDGILEIKGLLPGKYYIYEVESPYGYPISQQDGYKKDPSGTGITYGKDNGWVYKGCITLSDELGIKEITCLNQLKTGDMNIIKVDKRNVEQVKMEAGFKLYYTDTNKWLNINKHTENEITEDGEGIETTKEVTHISYEYVDSPGKANTVKTQFTNGKNILPLTDLEAGKYKIYEVIAPDGYYLSAQEGYMADDISKNNKWVYCGEYEVKKDETKEIEIDNKKTINISGYVWLDELTSKDNDYNNSYDQNDKKVAGVQVTLKKKSDNSIVSNIYKKQCTAKTGSDGSYKFEDVLINELSNYYIEFNYLSVYEQAIPVPYKASIPTCSKALIEDIADKEYKSYKSKGIATTYKGNDETKESTYGLMGYFQCKKDNKAVYYNSSNNTLENINLGIKQLPETSYTLQQDIVNAEINLDGIKYTYTYGQRGNKDYEGVPTVNWQDENDIRAYTADIYPSDIANIVENNEDIDKNIDVKVKYKIDITNTTTYKIEELYVENLLKIDEVKNLFDNTRYELADSNWENPTSKDESTTVAKMTVDYLEEIYGDGIAKNETKTAYITFKVNPEAIIEILKNPSGIIEDYPTKAVASAYHEYERKDYSWSNDISKVQTHQTNSTVEEDTAPYLVFKLGNQRAVSGVVFEDENQETNGEILGNGQYDNSEERLSGIKVELIYENGEVVKLYHTLTATSTEYTDYTTSSEASTTTDSNGNYSFVGILPDKYYIRFTYGDGTQTIADYKSTIITSDAAKKALGYSENSNGNEWYKCVESNNYSVAVDNFDSREQYNQNKKDKEKEATTPCIEMEAICSGTKPTTTKVILNDSTEIDVDCYVYDVFNFGIIRQPEQRLDISKNITNIKITNTQGNVVVNGNPGTDVMAGVTSLDNRKNATGYVKLEIPEDEIYGSKLTVTYEITITNKSDINYYETDSQYEGWYYKFGDTSNAIELTTTAATVYDYLDPALTYVSSNSEEINGEKIDVADKKVKDLSGDEIESQKDHIEDMFERKEQYENILVITNWRDLLSEINGESADRLTKDTVEIIAEKTLTTDDDDMEFISTAKIITAKDPEPALVSNKVKLPDPEDAITTLSAPTGADMQTPVIYTIIGITSLAIIAIGAIIIKKIVLK